MKDEETMQEMPEISILYLFHQGKTRRNFKLNFLNIRLSRLFLDKPGKLIALYSKGLIL